MSLNSLYGSFPTVTRNWKPNFSSLNNYDTENDNWMFLEIDDQYGDTMEDFSPDGWILDDGDFSFIFQGEAVKFPWISGKTETSVEEFPKGIIFKNLELSVL